MTLTADLTIGRLALEAAVDQLTRPEHHKVDQGADGATAVTVPSLLAQLHAARLAGQGLGVGERVPDCESRPPLWLDPASLLAAIEVAVRRHDRPTLSGRLRAWLGEHLTTTDGDDLVRALELAEAWVREARAMLDPVSASEITGPCPWCWSDILWWRDFAGEWVRRHALRGTEDPLVVWCTAEGCSYRAEGEHLWLLSDHLQRQTAHEHLEG